MKHLLGGVAISAVLAIAAPVWAQQNPNNPSATSPTPPAMQNAQPATGAPPIPPAPQAQSGQRMAPQAQMPAQQGQNANGAMQDRNAQSRMQNAEQRTNATGGREEKRMSEAMPRHHHRNFGRYYGHGLAYRMGEPRRHWWRHTHAWRFRHHHWGYARAYGGPEWRYGWHRHWPSDFVAEQLNAQELGTTGTMTTTTTQYYGASAPQYYGTSTPPMAYSASAGFEGPAPAPMGYGGSVLWYPPGSNPPSPPGFPPPFWFW